MGKLLPITELLPGDSDRVNKTAFGLFNIISDVMDRSSLLMFATALTVLINVVRKIGANNFEHLSILEETVTVNMQRVRKELLQ